ncbi:acetylcholine-gated cation-selective channel [Mactra antiquata]
MDTMVLRLLGFLMLFPVGSLSADVSNNVGLGRYEDRARLKNDLFVQYDRTLEPNDEFGTIRVNHSISRAVLVSFENGVMEVSFWNGMQWFDSRLVWDPSAYGNVSKLDILRTDIWEPDFHVIESIEPYNGYPNPSIYATVQNNGHILLYPPESLKVACPYNEQDLYTNSEVLCTMKFSVWTHTCREIEPHIESEDIETVYSLDHRWKVVSTKAVRNVLRNSCCPEIFCDVTYTFHLKRVA